MRFVYGNSLTAPKFTLHLYPVVILRNLMPIPISYTLAVSSILYSHGFFTRGKFYRQPKQTVVHATATGQIG